MEKYLKDKRIIVSTLVVLAIAIGLSFFFYNRGRTNLDDWSSISTGMDKETVTEYLGSPADKTIKSSEISDTYHTEIFAAAMDGSGELKDGMKKIGYDLEALESLYSMQDSGVQVEMYTYKINKSKHYIYFVDNSVYTKK